MFGSQIYVYTYKAYVGYSSARIAQDGFKYGWFDSEKPLN